MPDTLDFSGARVPLATEANNPPADLLRFGQDIDPHLVLFAASLADRDAKYGNLPKDALVSCSALGLVWQKTSSPPAVATWRTIAQVGALVTTGIVTPATGDWSVPMQQGKILAPQFRWINMTVSYSGPDVTGSPNGGNINDITSFVQLGNDWRPVGQIMASARTTLTDAKVDIPPGGGLIIRGLGANGTLRTGDSVSVTASYPTAS